MGRRRPAGGGRLDLRPDVVGRALGLHRLGVGGRARHDRRRSFIKRATLRGRRRGLSEVRARGAIGGVERLDKLHARRKPARRLLCQDPGEDLSDRRRKLRVPVLRLVPEDLAQDRRQRRPVERETAGQHPEGDDSEGKLVGAAVDLVSLRLLRRHEVGSAEREPGLRHRGARGELGHSEVGDLHGPVRPDHDVGRLDVSVDDAATVGVVERLRRLTEDAQKHRGGLRDARLEDRLERRALDVLHDDVGVFSHLADVVDRYDSRVGKDPGRLGFPSQAPAQLLQGRIIPNLGHADGFDRNRPPDDGVGRRVDHPHRPSPQLLEDPVPTDLLHSRSCIPHLGALAQPRTLVPAARDA